MPRKPRKRVTAKFCFPFIQKCVPIIAVAAIVWAFSSIYFGIVFVIPVDMPTIVMIIIVVIGSWVAVIFAARKGNQFRALVLLFLVSALSGLAGWIHPIMVRVPIGCVIIIGLWWILGYLIHLVEHHSEFVAMFILLGILVDLGLYWYILTAFFQENWIDWAVYLVESILVFSAMVYDSFHVKEKDITNNRMWEVFKAILDMFIAFLIIAIVAIIIALAVGGADDVFNFSDFSLSGSGRKKKKIKIPGPGATAIQ